MNCSDHIFSRLRTWTAALLPTGTLGLVIRHRKRSLFHGGDTGSSPVGRANNSNRLAGVTPRWVKIQVKRNVPPAHQIDTSAPRLTSRSVHHGGRCAAEPIIAFAQCRRQNMFPCGLGHSTRNARTSFAFIAPSVSFVMMGSGVRVHLSGTKYFNNLGKEFQGLCPSKVTPGNTVGIFGYSRDPLSRDDFAIGWSAWRRLWLRCSKRIATPLHPIHSIQRQKA